MKTDINFERYVKLVLHKMNRVDKIRITSDALMQINTVLNLYSTKITEISEGICKMNNRKTISSGAIKSSMFLLQPNSSSYLRTSADKTLKKFLSNKGNGGDKATLANITLAPSRVEKLMRTQSSLKISENAVIYFSGVLDKLITEFIELARNHTLYRDAKTINTSDIHSTFYDDEDFNSFAKVINFTVAGGGVEQNISYKIIKKASEKREAKAEAKAKRK
jgi:histone H3/H4